MYRGWRARIPRSSLPYNLCSDSRSCRDILLPYIRKIQTYLLLFTLLLYVRAVFGLIQTYRLLTAVLDRPVWHNRAKCVYVPACGTAFDVEGWSARDAARCRHKKNDFSLLHRYMGGVVPMIIEVSGSWHSDFRWESSLIRHHNIPVLLVQ